MGSCVSSSSNKTRQLIGIDAYTKLMLHADGSGSSFIDSSLSPKSITAYGATQSATVSKFGGKSAYFNGTNSYLSVPLSSDFNLGTGDFTIDFWYYPLSLPVSGSPGMNWQFLYTQTNTVNACYFAIMNDTALQWRFSSGDNIRAAWNTSLSLNTWHHIAFVRQGNIFRLFQNGSQLDGGQSFPYVVEDGVSASAIGATVGGTTYFLNAYLDEYRFSKGIARWTSNFVLPTSAYV